ncbi:phospholipase D-like domain-containing protein [Streptomyces sp. NBC_01571]|uniref:phospholipase D-like domain-containing protein n=1 Tax=Streptomyces sp. NBC_01571 TaxID=2975883 RepID=UPI00338E7297
METISRGWWVHGSLMLIVCPAGLTPELPRKSAARSNPMVIRPVRQVKQAASPSPPRGATTGRPISRACWRLCATDSRRTVWWRGNISSRRSPDRTTLYLIASYPPSRLPAWPSPLSEAPPHPRPAQPVVTGPLSTAIPARLASGVAHEVIRSADTSLLIAGFAAHGAGDVVAEIAEAVGRGVVWTSCWRSPHGHQLPSPRYRPRGPSGTGGASTGVLHAKLIAADRHTALLGSANLTDRAPTDNIELGVALRDPGVVGPLVDHFRWLISPENGIMRRA